jgi:hypothetical protein
MKFLLVLALAALGWFGYQRYFKDAFILTESREENLVKIRALATKLNAGLPKEVDAETTWLGIDATSRGFLNRYKTSLGNGAAQYSGDRESPAFQGLRRDACGDRRFKAAMEHGFTVSYAWVDANSNALGTYVFRNADCAGL